MIGALKLIPLATVLAGGVASKDKLMDQYSKIINITQVVAVQSEVNDIAKMIYLDTIDQTAPTVEAFQEYVRKNMRTKVGQSRDTSLDFWGTAYKFERDPDRIVVMSAGPDKEFSTEDDIQTGYQL